MKKRLLTYREAARRVHRSVRTIRRWRRSGMPMSLDKHGRRVVDETVLLEWLQKRLEAWPPHQYRMRRLFADEWVDPESSQTPKA